MTFAELIARLKQQKVPANTQLSVKGEPLVDVLVDSHGKVRIVTEVPDTDPPEPKRVKCPECQGSGVVGNPSAGTCDSPWMTCPMCQGAKWIGE